MIAGSGYVDPSLQQAENRMNYYRIGCLVLLALLLLAVVAAIIHYSKQRDHQPHIPQIVRHHLINLKHSAQRIGTHLFAR